MHAHHERAIAHATTLLRRDPAVRALLLGGSIAHGFESAASDVDLLIVVFGRGLRRPAARRSRAVVDQRGLRMAGWLR